MNTAEEFWSRVSRGQKGKCWEWQGARNSTGYGNLIFRGKPATAHRVAAFLSRLINEVAAPKDRKGDGFILHKCDNPKCCNPEHFNIGTYSRNQMEAYSRARRSAPKGHTHTNAKLSALQVKQIRKQYAQGDIRQVDLASKFCVSQRVISLVVRNETYKE